MNFLTVLTRTSETITGTPLLKETVRVIIVDVKDITAGIADPEDEREMNPEGQLPRCGV